MNTKNKHSEHTANLSMVYTAATVAHIGRNFAKPVPRLAKTVNKSFMQKLLAMGKKR